MKNLIACVIGGAVAAGNVGGAGVALDTAGPVVGLDNPAGVRLLHGIARPGRDVTLSFYLDGTVASLSDEGRVVRAGEVLASLDDRAAPRTGQQSAVPPPPLPVAGASLAHVPLHPRRDPPPAA